MYHIAYNTHNPYTGKTTATFDYLSDDELEKKIEKSHEAFLRWKQTNYEERAEILSRAADLTEQRKKEYSFSQIISISMLARQKAPEPAICSP